MSVVISLVLTGVLIIVLILVMAMLINERIVDPSHKRARDALKRVIDED